MGPFEVVFVEGKETFGAEVGFVGVEGFDMEKPTFLAVVTRKKVETALKGACLREMLLPADIVAVDPILLDGNPLPYLVIKAFGMAVRGVSQVGDPGITLLAPNALPRRIFRVVIGAAFFPVVVVVAEEVCGDAMRFEN